MVVLPEPLIPDLFILFPPGARGDFLAAVLKDCLCQQYKNYIIDSPSGYQKCHYVKDLAEGWIDRYKTKIRIKLSRTEEYLTVANLWLDKLPKKLPKNNSRYQNHEWTTVLKTLIDEYSGDPLLDQDFDYLVDFQDLYDIEAIIQLYRKINTRDIDSDTIEKIKFNIELQPWVSQVMKIPGHCKVAEIGQHHADH